MLWSCNAWRTHTNTHAHRQTPLGLLFHLFSPYFHRHFYVLHKGGVENAVSVFCILNTVHTYCSSYAALYTMYKKEHLLHYAHVSYLIC